jgi:cell division protein ZapA
MSALIDISIAGRTYQVACREGEEDNLRAAARLVDARAARRSPASALCPKPASFLFASLLLADQLIENRARSSPAAAASGARPGPTRKWCSAPKRSRDALNRSPPRLRTRRPPLK